MTNRELKATALAVTMPVVVGLALAILTGASSIGFFCAGVLVGWLYLRRRVESVRGIRLFVLYLLAEAVTVVVAALALALFASPW
jgi:hypothetical protein